MLRQKKKIMFPFRKTYDSDKLASISFAILLWKLKRYIQKPTALISSILNVYSNGVTAIEHYQIFIYQIELYFSQ